MAKNELNLEEAKKYLKSVIVNNIRLEKDTGRKGIPICLESPAGFGKTSVIKSIRDSGIKVKVKNGDIVKEKTKTVFVKSLIVAGLQESGDILGYPIAEFKVKKDGEIKWVPESQIKDLEYLGETRMGYAVPEWLQEGLDSGCDIKILNLDDFSRSNPEILQALMELIDQKETVSWKLGSDWQIMLTANPSNGIYSVAEIDPALKSRYITWAIKYNNEVWCNWALANGIDERAVNFIIHSHSDIYGKNDSLNPRIVTKLFDVIKYVPDWSSPEGQAFIAFNAESIVPGDAGSTFASLLNSFISNKLDKLPTPAKLLSNKNTKEMIKELSDLVGTYGKANYRSDIAAILMFRISNYLVNSEKKISNIELKNTVELLLSDSITEDLSLGICDKISKSKSAILGRLIAADKGTTLRDKLIL